MSTAEQIERAVEKPRARGRPSGRPRDGFKGVSEAREAGTFKAFLRANGKTHALGTWLRELDAAIARDRAVLWFGVQTSLNMPSESRELGPCSPEDLKRIALSKRKLAIGRSRFRGVGWNSAIDKWRVSVLVDGKRDDVEGFESEEEAALAYDRIVIGLGGDRSRLNFPDRPTAPISAHELREQLHARRKSKTSSIFHCVSRTPKNRWHAWITAQGVRHSLGEWTEESAAAEAYDRAALFFGDTTRRNFPERALVPTSPSDLRAEQRALTKAECTSAYHGVSWYVDPDGRGHWRATVSRDDLTRCIGAYDDERDAAIAYDRLAREWFGAEARLNFPEESHPAASLEELRAENRARYKETTTSRYNGVCWIEQAASWKAYIQVDNVLHVVGFYDDEAAAARAVDRKRWELLGEGPYNLPDEIPAAKRPLAANRRRRVRRSFC